MATDDIALVFSKLDMPKEHIEFIMRKLYKYKNDPIVAAACEVINNNKGHIENFYDIITELKILDWFGVKPLMMLAPKDPLSLRVYPNIPIKDGSKAALADISPLNCNSVLADFLQQYEEGNAKEHSKKAWELETATKRLNQYVDMPTARALSRYAELGLKDHQIRDLAAKIDLYRKPMELLWATTPEDYLTMYTGGPNSCMSPESSAKWGFMTDQGICPASMYAFMPHCKGAFIKKNGKTVARAVCYWNGPLDKDNQPTGKGQWYYGRVYSAGAEYTNKFIQQLKDHGMTDGQGSFWNPPVGTTFKVKGYKKEGSIYIAPISYADNLDRVKWSATYDPASHDFTFTFGSTDRNRIGVNLESRNGYILSHHYMSVECSNCGTNFRGQQITPTLDSEEIFCSDTCAHEAGYVKVISGDGSKHYQLEQAGLIDVVGASTVKYSTLTAARQNSRFPVMDEPGILSEEGSIKVVYRDTVYRDLVDDTEGNHWVIASPESPEGLSLRISTCKVPFEIVKKKTVQYEENHQVVKQEFDVEEILF